MVGCHGRKVSIARLSQGRPPKGHYQKTFRIAFAAFRTTNITTTLGWILYKVSYIGAKVFQCGTHSCIRAISVAVIMVAAIITMCITM
eukprot:scaffold153859_cov46-Attheya_sp.AAC.1